MSGCKRRRTIATPFITLNSFIDWLPPHCAELHNVAVVENDDGYRRVIAQRDISPGTIICRISNAVILTAERAHEELKQQNVKHDLIDGEEIICLFLILCKHFWVDCSSLWHSYVQCLPLDMSNHPRTWNENDWSDLYGFNAHAAAKTKLESTEINYKEFTGKLRALQIKKICTLPRYEWAHHILASRGFDLRLFRDSPISTENKRESALLPLLDMFNHHPGRKIIWKMTKAHIIFIHPSEATAEIRQGEEIMNNYGQKSNDELLIGYGFTIMDNLDDNVAFSLVGGRSSTRDTVYIFVTQGPTGPYVSVDNLIRVARRLALEKKASNETVISIVDEWEILVNCRAEIRRKQTIWTSKNLKSNNANIERYVKGQIYIIQLAYVAIVKKIQIVFSHMIQLWHQQLKGPLPIILGSQGQGIRLEDIYNPMVDVRHDGTIRRDGLPAIPLFRQNDGKLVGKIDLQVYDAVGKDMTEEVELQAIAVGLTALYQDGIIKFPKASTSDGVPTILTKDLLAQIGFALSETEINDINNFISTKTIQLDNGLAHDIITNTDTSMLHLVDDECATFLL